MSDAAIDHCPECGGNVKRLISGGAGAITKGASQPAAPASHPELVVAAACAAGTTSARIDRVYTTLGNRRSGSSLLIHKPLFDVARCQQVGNHRAAPDQHPHQANITARQVCIGKQRVHGSSIRNQK